MSRIGKLPIAIPKGVEVALSEGEVSVKGPKGSQSCEIPPHVTISNEDGQLVVSPEGNEQASRAMQGLARTLVANMVTGVSTGFSRSLEINGTGYTVESKDGYIVFNLGYSHPIYYELPEGVEAIFEPKSKTKITVAGINKQAVGSAAAKIRSFRPPEPYKGKGVKYADEVIRRKEGKSGGR